MLGVRTTNLQWATSFVVFTFKLIILPLFSWEIFPFFLCVIIYSFSFKSELVLTLAKNFKRAGGCFVSSYREARRTEALVFNLCSFIELFNKYLSSACYTLCTVLEARVPYWKKKTQPGSLPSKSFHYDRE